MPAIKNIWFLRFIPRAMTGVKRQKVIIEVEIPYKDLKVFLKTIDAAASAGKQVVVGP